MGDARSLDYSSHAPDDAAVSKFKMRQLASCNFMRGMHRFRV